MATPSMPFVDVFSAQADNGDSTVLEFKSPNSGQETEKVGLMIWGTWASGSITVKYSPDNVTWIDSGITAITANKAVLIELLYPYVKLVLASVVGAGANLNARVFGPSPQPVVTQS